MRAALLLSLAALLAACGGGGPGTTPPPVTGLDPYVPTATTPVGTGPDASATLRTEMGYGDVDLMNAINEFRTTGKIGGVDATAGTCVAGNFTPRVALRFNGILHHAAYKHNLYKKETVISAHEETVTSAVNFWGTDPGDRIARSAALFGVSAPAWLGEAIGGGEGDVNKTLHLYLTSPPHCAILMDPQARQVGASMIGDPSIKRPSFEVWNSMTQREQGQLMMSIATETILVAR